MNSQIIRQLCGRLMRLATAPYHEHAARAEVEKVCASHGLDFRRDPFGNVLVQLRTAPKQRPLVLAAHLDHPGFEVVRRIGGRRWLVRFRGGVPAQYFRPGIPVRLIPSDIPAKLGSRKGKPKDKSFEVLTAREPDSKPRFAVWDLEDFAVRQGRIVGRACDDLVGVAAALATMIELKRSAARVNVMAVISRAEEVGFHGALAASAHRELPRNSLVISLETSRELPGVKLGSGVILRVGDKTSIFDSAAMRFLSKVAAGMQPISKGFRFQRALMGGGTCEATAYQEFGLQSAGVCVALGNYHNCGEGNRIRAEYVSMADAVGMVRLLVAAAKQMSRFEALTSELPTQLKGMGRAAERELRRTASVADG